MCTSYEADPAHPFDVFSLVSGAKLPLRATNPRGTRRGRSLLSESCECYWSASIRSACARRKTASGTFGTSSAMRSNSSRTDLR